MAWRRVNVRQGTTYVALVSSLLLASACSSDSSVSFDPNPDLSGAGSTAGTGNEAGMTASTAGSSSQAGSGSEGGSSENGGKGSAGSAVAGTHNDGGMAGTAAGGATGNAGAGMAGTGSGGAGTGGTGNDAGSSSGGSGGMGGLANGGAAGSGMAGVSGSGGSNGGFCSTGLFGNHNYAFCGEVDSAAAATAKCQSLGMRVVSIESKAENDYVEGKQSSTWLGASDEGTEGEWRWAATGVLFWNKKQVPGVYSNFTDGQPSNKDNDGQPENCLVLTEKGWNDVGCALSDIKVTCESAGTIFPPP